MDYWEHGVACPDLLLGDLVAILHPEFAANHHSSSSTGRCSAGDHDRTGDSHATPAEPGNSGADAVGDNCGATDDHALGPAQVTLPDTIRVLVGAQPSDPD
ncbi:hypothetical protein [Mycobacterium uberis]|uniref:hypothetical protein n=1 Tax=Mycobacterium uberis TaxID=2162698 RepID=UPI001FB381BC|nr:hypothetical protein [Mycobacterium uberis]